jgi:hypothetical protein
MINLQRIQGLIKLFSWHYFSGETEENHKEPRFGPVTFQVQVFIIIAPSSCSIFTVMFHGF